MLGFFYEGSLLLLQALLLEQAELQPSQLPDDFLDEGK